MLKVKMDKSFSRNINQKQISKPVGCIIAFGIVWFFVMLFMPFIKVLSEMYQDMPTRWRAIFIWIPLIAVISFIIKVRKIYRLDKAIEKWAAIRKTVKIIDFKYANKNGGENESTSWYFVIMSDWENKYKWKFHRWAKIYWKSEEELMNDDFYMKEWITLDLNNRDITRQQLDQKISELKSEKDGVNLLKTIKSVALIEKLENKKHDLEPYHLHTGEWNFYIWDEYVILIDPDDPSNYTSEKGNV